MLYSQCSPQAHKRCWVNLLIARGGLVSGCRKSSCRLFELEQADIEEQRVSSWAIIMLLSSRSSPNMTPVLHYRMKARSHATSRRNLGPDVLQPCFNRPLSPTCSGFFTSSNEIFVPRISDRRTAWINLPVPRGQTLSSNIHHDSFSQASRRAIFFLW